MPLLTWYVPKVVTKKLNGKDHKILEDAAYSLYTYKTDENERYKVFPNGTLRVTDLSNDDSGKFICRANTIKDSTERHLTLTVMNGTIAKIESFTKQTKGTLGLSTKISCNVSGDPFPDVIWTTPKGRELQESYFSRSEKYSKRDYATGSELFIRQLTVEDAGEWTCTAENFVGAQDTQLGVTVEEVKQEEADDYALKIGLGLVGLVVAVVIGIGIYYLYRFIRTGKLRRKKERLRKQKEEEQVGMRM